MIDYREEVQPGLPKALNLQHAVRELNERLELVEVAVFGKSSGDDLDAGVWTQAGDGTTYPVVPTQEDADKAQAIDPAEDAKHENQDSQPGV